jgi:catechol 2,3-dioxygenase-like lactoylglutathione lyase family enzyme
MGLPDAPIAQEGFFATHFFTVRDQEKSRDFYVRILGGKVIRPKNPCYIKLANSWIILNSGGGPTPDKPEVILEPPSAPDRVSSFLNLRVADIWACYNEWRAKGAVFLTEPLDNHGVEWRCYMRDPDGYLIEVGQYTQVALDHFKKYVHETAAERNTHYANDSPASENHFGTGAVHRRAHRLRARPREAFWKQRGRVPEGA